MTQIKHQIKIITLAFTLVLTNTAFAADQITNENKNNCFSNTISDANNADYTDGNTAFTSNIDVNTSSGYQQIIQRHHQLQEAQLEMYQTNTLSASADKT